MGEKYGRKKKERGSELETEIELRPGGLCVDYQYYAKILHLTEGKRGR